LAFACVRGSICERTKRFENRYLFGGTMSRRRLHLNPYTLAKILPLLIGLIMISAICTAASAVSIVRSAIEIGAAKDSALSSLFTPQVLAWKPQILRWSEDYGLDPNLVATVMQIESCGNPHAVSRSGAQGLFQVMPFHFTGGEDMQDPETNARRGLVYLAESLLQSEGDVRRALAGYNGGHGVIEWNPSQWSAETQRYAYWGDGIFTDATRGRRDSARLKEWLAAGGESLCSEAG
jgi:soluble lytic murein transglycosylase-like protein